MSEEFALYLDDSGSPKPDPNDPYPFFALGGVLIRRSDENTIRTLLTDFKNRRGIPQETPLHGNEIRSKKKRFAWLGKLPPEEYNDFMEDLTTTIVSSPIIVHACVVSRHGYLKRYLETYGDNTWEMMKSGFSILVERAAKYVASQNGTLMVYFEAIGKKEDKLLKEYFKELRLGGHPFDANRARKYSPLESEHLSVLLRGIDSKTKNNPVMQLADLCLYPVVQSKKDVNNRAFLALQDASLLVDCHLDEENIETVGIKYYCFDNA
jgi:hypothetical protein